jgi:hypothetical protein
MPIGTLKVSKTVSMKNFYITAVKSYRKNIGETVANAIAFLGGKTTQLRGIKAVILAAFIILNGFVLHAQNCPASGTTVLMNNENTYYPGTQANVAVGATSITLGAIGAGANFGNTPIASGDIVLVIQMQGAQIFVPAGKSFATYGGNANVGSGMITTNLIAGYMEFAVATNAVPIGGGVLNLAAGLNYNYQYAPYGATGQYTYQVIRVSTHFNIQLGATITTPFWNGSTGGVTVISAVNQLDFNTQTVNASGAGFRGGATLKLRGGTPGVNKTDYYQPSTILADASKGEGVAGTPRYIYFNNVLVDNVVEGYPSGSYCRGGAGNAGGGATDSDPSANDQNAGGGGGGNGGSGGLGGNGWFSFGLTGGHGGTPLQTYGAAPIYPITTYYSPSRLIMGGGGGGGSNNDGTGIPAGGNASSGATGGGMVIINSSTIIGTGTINANGLTGNSTVQIDGSGGGGAGGSILIYANSGQAGITAIANGGNGGSNDPLAVGATQHGPGGGGGGGVIFSNAALNIASSVTQGSAGISTGTSGVTTYGAGDGFVGVLTQTFPLAQLPPNMQICQSIVLPVTLVDFSASYVSANNVKVAWTTTNELNAGYFEVERSTDGTDFIGVAQVDASSSLDPIHFYSINDQLFNINGNIIYYRLRIVDNDGKYTYSKTIPVKLNQPENSFSVYPNPVDNYAILNLYAAKPDNGMLRLMDNSGRQILTKSFTITNGNNSIMVDQLGNLPKGIYNIQVLVNNNLYNQKIIKK